MFHHLTCRPVRRRTIHLLPVLLIASLGLACSGCKRPDAPLATTNPTNVPHTVFFEASGGPGWALSLSRGHLTGRGDSYRAGFDYNYGEKHLSARLNRLSDRHFTGSGAVDEGNGQIMQPLRIVLEQKTCTTESGATRPVTAVILLGEQSFEGCGAFKEDAEW